MHLLKFSIDVLQTVYFSTLDIIDQGIYLALRSYQAGNVHPLTATHCGVGLQAGTYFFIAFEFNTFQTFDDRVSKEFMDGDLIELDTLHQCRVTDLRTMERIDIGKFARSMAQVLQSFPSLEHLLHGIGTE